MNDLPRTQRAWPCLAGALVALAVAGAMQPAAALEKEVSLVTKEPIGALAVAGRLSIDLHADFMASRTYESDTVLNWYNCGYSGGGGEGGSGAGRHPLTPSSIPRTTGRRSGPRSCRTAPCG